ncbi:MAG: hypothetical protein KAW16_08550 [candidate division Zixibacteria bacterium]|nr:hypothetical protein [candidate division Zixibacteria bacterium]MCK4428517.1 hypothetical protein [candidate division Zixibacteria bacterium]
MVHAEGVDHLVTLKVLRMTEQIILVTMLGGLLAFLDKTEAYQTNFSQPLVTGSIIGFLLTDLHTGIKIWNPFRETEDICLRQS